MDEKGKESWLVGGGGGTLALPVNKCVDMVGGSGLRARLVDADGWREADVVFLQAQLLHCGARTH